LRASYGCACRAAEIKVGHHGNFKKYRRTAFGTVKSENSAEDSMRLAALRVCDSAKGRILRAVRQPSSPMAKHSLPKPAAPAMPVRAKSRNPFALNPNFNQQTRKMLGKHYRAKFGVK
jgi:hypothetical protein